MSVLTTTTMIVMAVMVVTMVPIGVAIVAAVLSCVELRFRDARCEHPE